MEYLFLLFLILAGLALLINVFGNLYGIVAAIINHAFGDELHTFFLRKPLAPGYQSILSENFSYYKHLDLAKKSLFEKKVQRFIDSKEFIAGNDLNTVTDEMKVLIAATAIQITFGFPRIYLKHFSRIYIYANAYLSHHTGKYHYGEVNPKGAIVLSWEKFQSGWADETDGRNLGLHEMAHALKIEDLIDNQEYNFLHRKTLLKFIGEGRREIHRMINGESDFFRPYAATNDHEFFAVVVENFFERPADLQKHNPTLYFLTTRLLNQDPLHSRNYSRTTSE